MENQLTMAMNFISFKEDSDEIRLIYSPSDNIEIMPGNETDKIIEDVFDSFLQRYQKALEESMSGNDFFF